MIKQKPLVLITDYVHFKLIDGLDNLGYDIDFKPEIAYSDIHGIIHDYHGIVINSKVKMNAELLNLASQLKFIARLGSGLDIIDLPEAERLGIHVFSAPDGNRVAVAEHAIGMLLALSNKLLLANWQVNNFQWDRESCRGWEIDNKTIGVIGFGNNGSAFAERLAGFNCQVLAYDKYKTNYTSGYEHVKEVTLEELLKESDVISFHVPLTVETKHMLDDAFLKNVKKGVYIINTSRGKVVDTKSLLRGLESNKIAGACMDVFENEKTKSYTEDELSMYTSLCKMENVIFSPHVAGWTKESFEKISDSLLSKIASL